MSGPDQGSPSLSPQPADLWQCQLDSIGIDLQGYAAAKASGKDGCDDPSQGIIGLVAKARVDDDTFLHRSPQLCLIHQGPVGSFPSVFFMRSTSSSAASWSTGLQP